MSLHSKQTKIHAIENWSFANMAARTANGEYTNDDLGKIGYQQDNFTYWRLVQVTNPGLTATPNWRPLIGMLSCTSLPLGAWNTVSCVSSGHPPPNDTRFATLSNLAETIIVPAGNPGVINIHLDTITGFPQVNKNGTEIDLVLGDNLVNVLSGNQIFFTQRNSHTTCDAIVGTIAISGTVYDNTTGIILDTFNLNY